MPGEAFNWMGRIKAVEREYGAIRLATDRLLVAVNDDPSILAGQVRQPDIGTASNHLEGTYIVRVFSEFETALQLSVAVRRGGMSSKIDASPLSPRLASAAIQGRPLNRNRDEVSVPTEEKMAGKKTDQDNSKHPRT